MEELKHVKEALLTAAEGHHPFTPVYEALAAINAEIDKQIDNLKKKEDEKLK